MTSILKSITVAFAMYSRIPMPKFRWDTKDMKYHLAFFPWVGGVIGILEYIWYRLVHLWGLGGTANLLIAMAIPVLVTGGFHLDGLMDTEDALSSWRTREERLEILEDPHIGAFAVIRLILFGLIYGAALSELSGPGRILWMGTFVLSRCLSGMAVVTFPSAKKQGTLATEAGTAGRGTVRMALLFEYLLTSALMMYYQPLPGIILCSIGFLSLTFYSRWSHRRFGGITGDLAGWYLCKTELWMTLALLVMTILG